MDFDWKDLLFEISANIVMALVLVFSVLGWLILWPFLFWSKKHRSWFSCLIRALYGAEHKIKGDDE